MLLLFDAVLGVAQIIFGGHKLLVRWDPSDAAFRQLKITREHTKQKRRKSVRIGVRKLKRELLIAQNLKGIK